MDLKNLVATVKANKAVIIKRSLIILATGATIAVVAYAIKSGSDDVIVELTEADLELLNAAA